MLKIPEKLEPYRSLIQSFTSLSILQIANYLFPLIVLPYVVRVLGPAKYGLINFAAAFIAYFSLICDYGFNLSGTKAIAQIRDDKNKLSQTFSVILSIKLIFLVISFLILVLIIILIPFFNKNWDLYILCFGYVIGSVLFPNWFYQGMEQMRYITILQVSIRSIATILIFVLVNVQSDFLLFVLLNSSAQIIIGILGQVIAFYKFNIKFVVPELNEIKFQLKEGWNIFLSMISINLYTTSNTFILGLFASETVVGYFAAADKIRLAFQGVQAVITQSIFPFVNSLLNDSYDKFNSFIKRLLRIQPLIGLSISLFLFIFSFQLTDLVLGQKFFVSGELLKIIAWIPLFVSLSHIFGIQTLLPLGHEKTFNIIYSTAAICHLILLFVLVTKYYAFGTSISYVLTEFFVMVLTFLFVYKKRLLSFLIIRH